MIKTIMRHEWRILTTERIVVLSSVMFVVVTVLAFAASLADLPKYKIMADEAAGKQDEAHAKARETLVKDELELAGKGESLKLFKTFDTSPWNLQTEIANFTAVLLPTGLALAATGGKQLLPQSFRYQQYRDDSPTQPTVNGRSLGNVFTEKPTSNPLSQLIGRFDLSFITLYIFPLIILVLTYNLIAAEKENGTLALLLSQPVGISQIIAGKMLTRGLLVFAFGVLLPGLLIAVGQLVMLGEFSVWRFFIWTVAVTAYGAFWFAFAIWLNFTGASAARNALTLAVAWIAFAIIIPASTILAAVMISPPFSKIQFVDQERAARLEGNAKFYRTVNAVYDDFNRRYPRGTANSAQEIERERARMQDPAAIPDADDLLPSFFSAHPDISSEGLSVNQLMYITTAAREEYVENRLRATLEESFEAKQLQQSIIGGLSYFSPTALLQSILIDLAGTGPARNQEFVSQFDDYVRGRSAFLLRKMIAGERVAASEMDTVVPFVYREETVGQLFNRTIMPLMSILLFTAALCMFGRRALKIYRVAS